MAIDPSVIPSDPPRNGHLNRYNVMVSRVEGAVEDEPHNWIPSPEVIRLFLELTEGDEMHIQHAGQAEPGAVYPAAQE